MSRDAKHILIAEDNAALGTVLKFNLERNGYKATLARNGAEALSLLSQLTIDLLISDQQMPVLSGVELCRRMRLQPDHAETPVIMVTAKGLELDLETLRREIGITAIFPKPFSPAAIVDKVNECLGITV